MGLDRRILHSPKKLQEMEKQTVHDGSDLAPPISYTSEGPHESATNSLGDGVHPCLADIGEPPGGAIRWLDARQPNNSRWGQTVGERLLGFVLI